MENQLLVKREVNTSPKTSLFNILDWDLTRNVRSSVEPAVNVANNVEFISSIDATEAATADAVVSQQTTTTTTNKYGNNVHENVTHTIIYV